MKKGYTLYRVEGDENVEVSTHSTLAEAFTAGQDAVHADEVHAYVAYCGDRSVAWFCRSRLERTSTAAPDFAGLLS